MPYVIKNNAIGTLAGSLTDIATSLTLQAGQGALFAVTAPDYTYVTLDDNAGAIEVVKVTARSTDTLTIVRAQDGTTAVAWDIGDVVECRPCKVAMGDILAETPSLTALTSINGGPISGLRNPVTNGGFQIDTRNEAAAQAITATLTKCFDNWSVMSGAAPSGTLTVAQGSLTAGAAQSGKSAVLLRSAGSYTDDLRMVHVIPTADAQKYAGRTIKVGFKALAGSSWLGGNIKMEIFTGTGSDQGSASMVAGTWTTSASTTPVDTAITTSLVEYTGNAVIPSGTTEIGIRLRTGVFTGSGSGNDYAVITDVFVDQLDARSVEAERVLCNQRLRLIAGGVMGRAETTTQTGTGFTLGPPMATTPSASVVGTIKVRNVTAGLTTTATTPTINGSILSKSGGYLEMGAASWSTALAIGDITCLACDAVKSGILLSAEL